MRRIAGGDQDALSALYDATQGYVRGRALRILRDPADAEEVALEVFVQVWRSAADYDPKIGSPAAWLTMLTKSRSLDKLRSRRSRLTREASLPEPGEPTSSAASPEEVVRTGEERLRVQAALDQSTTGDRTVARASRRRPPRIRGGTLDVAI